MNVARGTATLVLAGLLAAGPAALAQEKPPSDPAAPLAERVEQALHFGAGWLKKQTFTTGSWETEIGVPPAASAPPGTDFFTQPTGCTSLALYALLRSGTPADDPVVRKGFQWLQQTSGGVTRGDRHASSYRVPNGTYELASLALALEARAHPRGRGAAGIPGAGFLPPPGTKLAGGGRLALEDLQWMKDLTEALEKRYLHSRGGWGYGFWNGREFQDNPAGGGDLSATTLAVAALLAGERCSIRQPDETYAQVLDRVLGLQETDGPEVPRRGAKQAAVDHARGWGYLGSGGKAPGRTATGSMTASALGTLYACASILNSRKSASLGPGLLERSEKAWRDGLAWLDRSWDLRRNPGSDSYHHYYLFALERLADACGQDTLAGRRWFEEGAAVLLDSQDPSGRWTRRDAPRPADLLDTCFALLFLGRATPPLHEGPK